MRTLIFLHGLTFTMVAAAGAAAGEPGVRSVLEDGAAPDDAADDTEAVQRTVDAVRAAGGGTVWFPRGRYLLRSVDIEHGMTFAGEPGAVLARLPARGKWERMLTTERRRWRGEHDSPPLVLRGLTFDGSRSEQGDYADYQLEQQHLLMLTADPAAPGRLVVTVEDCTFVEGAGDGVSIGTNVAATVRHSRARDVFRGGVVLHGGHSELTLEAFEAGGAEHWTGIDVEVSTPGWNGTLAVAVKLDQVELEGDFDVALVDGSRLDAAHVTTHKGGFSLYARDSTVRVRDSSFAIGPRDGRQMIYYPHDVVFERCTFTAVEAAGPEAEREFVLVEVAFETSHAAPRGQSLRLVETTFAIDSSVEVEDRVVAVATAGAASAEREVLLTLERIRVPQGFDVGVQLRQGGGLLVRDVSLDSATGVVLGSSPGYTLDARLENVSFGEHVVVAEDLPASAAGSRIEHVGVVLEAEKNVLATRYGLDQNAYLGSRTIHGRQAPLAAGGLTGDLWVVEDPMGGEPARWRCTRPHATRAEWQPIAELGNRAEP